MMRAHERTHMCAYVRAQVFSRSTSTYFVFCVQISYMVSRLRHSFALCCLCLFLHRRTLTCINSCMDIYMHVPWVCTCAYITVIHCSFTCAYMVFLHMTPMNILDSHTHDLYAHKWCPHTWLQCAYTTAIHCRFTCAYITLTFWLQWTYFTAMQMIYIRIQHIYIHWIIESCVSIYVMRAHLSCVFVSAQLSCSSVEIQLKWARCCL